MLSFREDPGSCLSVAKGCCESDAALGPVVKPDLQWESGVCVLPWSCCQGSPSVTAWTVPSVPPASGHLPFLLFAACRAGGPVPAYCYFGGGTWGAGVEWALGEFLHFLVSPAARWSSLAAQVRVCSHRVPWPHCAACLCLVNVSNLSQTEKVSGV